MKKIVILMAAFVFAACSSTPKAEETASTSDVEKKVMEATDTNTSTSSSTVEAPAPVEKKSKKKAKETVAQETTATESTTSSSSGSDFPAMTGTEKSSVTCSTKGETRKISVMTASEGGCGVVYNKAGTDKTVAVAKSDMNYCDSVSSKIKTNLEGAGFDCGGGTAAPSTGTSSDAPTSNQ